MAIKLGYYLGWVVTGLITFANLDDNDISLEVYRIVIGFITIFNTVDLLRNIIMLITLITVHIFCRRRALKARLLMQEEELNPHIEEGRLP